MRNSQNTLRWITLLFLAVSLVTFIACDQQDPMSSNSLEQPTTGKTLKFLKLPKAQNSLNKIVSVSEWITAQAGGQLRLSAEGINPTTNHPAGCFIRLTVAPNSMSQDAELGLSLDDEEFFIGNFDMIFSPHGIVFSSPALLDITVKYADLTGFNPDDLDIYYDNPDTGQWELMPRQSITVWPEYGYVKVVGAELPHFSRYAIGTEN